MKSKFAAPLAVLVAGGSSIKAAAGVVKCSEQTAYNISATAEFKTRVSEIRSEITTEAVGKLTAASTEAVDTLRELLSTTNEPTVRLNAAKAIFNALPSMTELHELRARIDAIEKQGPGLRVAR